MPVRLRCPPLLVASLALMALLGGLFTMILVLAARAKQSNTFNKAEPATLHELVFPLEKEVWANLTPSGSCPGHTFACSDRCLTLSRRCDGFVDCPDAKDEVGCACAFRMPPARFCDSYPDCFDESDEAFCAYCPKGYFNCGEGECVSPEKVCDSEVDCKNFMDENFCFRLSNELSSNENSDSSGFLMRNKNGVWYPVCANPYDLMESALASFACVSVTGNPLANARYVVRRLDIEYNDEDYFIYHYQGRFVHWRGCSSQSGLLVTCDDVRCGLNPSHLLPKPRGRIVGGDVSKPGAWPWHAAVYRNGSYSCGATLINHRWLISAAHCFLHGGYYEVQLGMLRRKSFTPHQKTYSVDRIVRHENFNMYTLDFDIALLRTAKKVEFDFWVRPICLPRPDSRSEWEEPRRKPWETPRGQLCTAIGWGDVGETSEDTENLMEVHVPLTSSCKRNHLLWLCAGFPEGGKDACQGDSGGPLMCHQDDGVSWYIAGVISGGTGCARPGIPGMYTRVAYYIDWIFETMQTSEYTRTDFPAPLSGCPMFKCAALGGGDCLEQDKVCDGTVDCYDASDETNCIRSFGHV